MASTCIGTSWKRLPKPDFKRAETLFLSIGAMGGISLYVMVETIARTTQPESLRSELRFTSFNAMISVDRLMATPPRDDQAKNISSGASIPNKVLLRFSFHLPMRRRRRSSKVGPNLLISSPLLLFCTSAPLNRPSTMVVNRIA